MEIIDFHTHPYLDCSQNICHYIEKYDASFDAIKPYFNGLGITTICGSVVPRDAEVFKSSKKSWADFERLNEAALELKQRWGDFYIPGFHVTPDFPEESCREIERMAACNVKLIGELVPYMCGWDDYSCEAMDEILCEAEKHSMIVNCHSMTKYNENMDAMVQKHPDLVIVAAHPGEKEGFLRHLQRMKMSKNYYLDLSGSGLFRHAMLRHGIDEFGAERFIFGTDFPTCNPAVSLGGVLWDPLISDEEREKICCLNAKSLLGI